MLEMDIPDNLLDFSLRFSTEDGCFDFLIQLRWPDGFICPKCGSKLWHHLKTRKRVIECANK
ncbi:transposase, partial [Magnetococcales bacterium HHB-1]